MSDPANNSNARPVGHSAGSIVKCLILLLAAIPLIMFFHFEYGVTWESPAPSHITDLQTVRSQVQLYRIQHNDEGPPPDRFAEALTNRTRHDHSIVGPNEPKDYDMFGPYLQIFPENPFNGLATVDVVAGTFGLGDLSHGWHYDTTSGEVYLDITEERLNNSWHD